MNLNDLISIIGLVECYNETDAMTIFVLDCSLQIALQIEISRRRRRHRCGRSSLLSYALKMNYSRRMCGISRHLCRQAAHKSFQTIYLLNYDISQLNKRLFVLNRIDVWDLYSCRHHCLVCARKHITHLFDAHSSSFFCRCLFISYSCSANEWNRFTLN